MATGDVNDFINRLNAILPPWFGNGTTPILEGVFTGYATMGSTLYSQYAFSILQTRIKTATGNFLDLISADFFGISLPRGAGETDASFRNRILANLLIEKATRRGMQLALFNLTGNQPRLFEPRRPADTGGYSGIGSPYGGVGYGVAGGWGNQKCPYQGLIDITLPLGAGIPGVDGYNSGAGGWSTASYFAYISLSNAVNPVTDQDVYNTVNAVKVYGTRCWVRITE
jgi:hypothetical protein